MHYSIKLPADFPEMDIRTLLEKEWLVPRKVRHFLRIRKNVLVNQEQRPFQSLVHGKDLITLAFEDSDYLTPKICLGEAKKIQTLFEDEHLIIVNKPAGMKTHPNQPDEADTLLNHLAAYLAATGQFPYVVHRLDKETSGAVLFAKNPFALPILGRLLEKRAIHRTYQAKVAGIIAEDTFTITKKIGRDRHDRRKRLIDEKNGRPAVTHVFVKERHEQQSETWVNCQLDTGRTHQIRVHLAAIGHPILGDPLYQTKPVTGRLMLHALEIQLVHPFSQEKLKIKAVPGIF